MRTTTFRNMKDETTAAGGLLPVTMGRLRDAVGAGRLAVGPLDTIAHALRFSGLKVQGGRQMLSNDHRAVVWLYDPSTLAGQAIEDALLWAELERESRPPAIDRGAE